MGHPGCSAAGGEANSSPPSLEGTKKGLAAPQAPRRTNRGMASSTSHPRVGTRPALLCPRPFWVLRTCLPTPASTRAAFAQTCFMDWRCGLGKWGPKEWVAEIKAGLVGGGHSLLPPLLPTVCQVPQPCPSCPMILPFPSLPSLQLGSGLNLPSWLLGPASSSASCLQSPAPVHPHKR